MGWEGLISGHSVDHFNTGWPKLNLVSVDNRRGFYKEGREFKKG